MGAVSYLPYAHTLSGAPVPIWNGDHLIVDRSTGVNVVCELSRLNGRWYKLATPADLFPDEPGIGQVPSAGRYVSAALTTLSIPAGYVWGACADNTDQPGRRLLDRAVIVTSAAAALAAILAARKVIKRRRLPRPGPGPGSGEEGR